MKHFINILSAAASALLLFLPAVSNAQSASSVSRPGNWIRKTTFTSADGTASYEDMTWYDGLGYPVQTVAGKAGGTSSAPNIVTPIVYDNMRRDDARTYLPFASSGGLDSQVQDAVSKQAQFYSALCDGETRAYAEKVYEPSPAGRPLSATREGQPWAGHPASMAYAVNTGEDGVMRFSYNHSQRKVQRNGTYAQGTLIRTTSTDEDGHRVDVFTDTWGKTICSRQFPDGGTAIETHYVYDLKDSLVCVIQPNGMDMLRTDAGISEIPFGGSFAQANCFTYLRDGLGRVIESQVPGGGVSEYAYDERDRLVAFASAQMAAHRLYRITRYDALNRVVSEYYAMFAEGTDAESLRLAMKTWDGEEDSLPAHTTVRRTYSASYYPFQTPGSGSGRGSTGRGAEDGTRRGTGDGTRRRTGNILPDPSNPTFEDSAQLDDEVFPEEEIVVDIVLEQSPLDFAPDALATSGDLDTDHNRGLLKEETVSSVPGIDGSVSNADTLSVTRRYYYDYRGNVIQMRELASDGWSATYSTRYDFAGNVTGTLESHTSPGGVTHSVKSDLTLAPRGNILSERIYANGSLITETEYSYDELMRPIGKTTGGLSETVTLDLRGWRTGSEVTRGNDTVFSQSLSYINPSQGVTPHWNGLISEATTMHFGNLPNTFQYEYDHAGRLLSAVSQRGSEDGIIYDANGNILFLMRGEIDNHTITTDLSMTYDGNRLVELGNMGTQQPGMFSYDYDESGNMTIDSRKHLQISHNVLNLPMIARDTVGNMTSTMTYTFLGDGTKTRARVFTLIQARGQSLVSTWRAGKRYRGSFVYNVSDSGVQTLESIAVSTGRLIVALSDAYGNVVFESDGFVTDHLGNVAAVVNLSDVNGSVIPRPGHHLNIPVDTEDLILEQSDYLPFGTRIEPAVKTQTTNRYRYAGKEEQNIAGMDLSLLDFGARYYDAFTCRWNAVDPLANKFYNRTPYNYCGNDPVNRFDPDGRVEIFARAAIGAIAGAATEGTLAVLEGNKSFREVMGAAAKGAVEGAVIGITLNPEAGVAAGAAVTAGKGAIAGALSGAAGSVVEQSISKGNVEGNKVLRDGIAGTVTGAASGGICGKVALKFKTTHDKAVSRITSTATYENAKQTIKEGLKRAGAQIGNGTKNEIQRNAKKVVSEAVEKEKAKNNFWSATSQYMIQEDMNAATGQIMDNL